MKMSDITTEGKGIDLLKTVGGAGWDMTKKAAGAVGNYLTKPKGYTDDAAKVVKAADDQIADIAAKKAALSPRATATSDKLSKKITDLEVGKPNPTEFTLGQKTARTGAKATAGTAAVTGAADFYYGDPEGKTSAERHPATATVGDLAHTIAGAPSALIGHTLGGPDKQPQYKLPPATASAQEDDLPPAMAKESIADILKLSGQRSITERDNVAGIVKPKEIVALHESKQLDECGGIMAGGPSTTASLSINATAGSGEEVANMLAAIMNLAGVKPVTGDMLGGETHPMPMVKAIDIISRDNPDAMNDVEIGTSDEGEVEEPMSGMEEEYANSPADANDVPDFDPNKMAYQPNDVEPGDRMDGTMPKGVATQESLMQAFEAYKNGR